MTGSVVEAAGAAGGTCSGRERHVLRIARRVLCVSALVVAACGGYGAVDFLGGRAPQSTGESGGGYSAEPRPLAVARVEDLGSLREYGSIVARDGGMSGLFDGSSVWLFGDTIFELGGSRGGGGISNSMAWTPDLDASHGLSFEFPVGSSGEPVPFLRESPSEHEFNRSHAASHCTAEPCGARWALWPQALAADPERGRMLVFYSKVYAKQEMMDFRAVGQSIAVWQGFGAPPVRPMGDEPEMMFNDPQRGYGSSAVVDGQELYVYGCSTGPMFTKPCRVARVRLDDALDVRAWRYWAGNGVWSETPEDARRVFYGNDLMSVAYNPYLARYLVVYTPPLTDQVLMRTAPRPEGPWSEPVLAFTTRTPSQLWVYDAIAHPELERDDGRVQYVTYSLATSKLTSEMRLVEVDLGDVGRVALAMVSGNGPALH